MYGDFDWGARRGGGGGGAPGGSGSTEVLETFTGDALATSFVLADAPNSEPVSVFYGGQYLFPSLTVGFSYTRSGATISWLEDNAAWAVPSGEKIAVIYHVDN